MFSFFGEWCCLQVESYGLNGTSIMTAFVLRSGVRYTLVKFNSALGQTEVNPLTADFFWNSTIHVKSTSFQRGSFFLLKIIFKSIESALVSLHMS